MFQLTKFVSTLLKYSLFFVFGCIFSIVKVRETRLTGLLSSLLIALSLLMLPTPLTLIPTPVLDGLFLFMAITALDGNQMFERALLLVTEQVSKIIIMWCGNYYLYQVVHTLWLVVISGPYYTVLPAKFKTLIKPSVVCFVLFMLHKLVKTLSNLASNYIKKPRFILFFAFWHTIIVAVEPSACFLFCTPDYLRDL